MANSADPDQLAASEAKWSGSVLLAKQGISGFSRTRVKQSSRVPLLHVTQEILEEHFPLKWKQTFIEMPINNLIKYKPWFTFLHIAS